MSDFKKIINYSAVSDVLTGSKNVIRENRTNLNHSEAMDQLYHFLDLWVEKNAKSKEVKVTIKTKAELAMERFINPPNRIDLGFNVKTGDKTIPEGDTTLDLDCFNHNKK